MYEVMAGRSEVRFVEGHVVLVRMVAGRTFFGRRGAFVYVAAHETLPFDGLFTFPHGAFVDLFQISFEAAAVVLFDFSDSTEMGGDFGEALFISHFGAVLIEFDTLFELFVSCGGEVGGGVAVKAAAEILPPSRNLKNTLP